MWTKLKRKVPTNKVLMTQQKVESSQRDETKLFTRLKVARVRPHIRDFVVADRVMAV